MSQRRRSNILRVGQDSVVVPARVAHLLEQQLDLAALRVRLRGLDPEASGVLEDIHLVALEWSSALAGTRAAELPEPAEESVSKEANWMSTTQAAGRLGMTDRGVRKAIREGRLNAHLVDERYRITFADLEHFRARRVA